MVAFVEKLLSAGTKPVFENAAPTKPLEYYDVPLAYRRILTTNGEMTAENKSVELIELEKKLRTPLRDETYATFFQTLLWAEELQMEIEIRRYDLRAPLQKTTKLLRLAVPGLAEKRPSVLLGDKFVISPLLLLPLSSHSPFPLVIEFSYLIRTFLESTSATCIRSNRRQCCSLSTPPSLPTTRQALK